MPRSIRLADKLGAAAGIGAAVLIFLSVALVDPQRGVTDQELLTWWQDSGNRNAFVFSMYALLFACPLFLLFVSRLRTRLRAADAGGWADAAFASGIVATAALGLCAILRGAVAGSMRFADEPLPGVDTIRFQTGVAYAMWDLVILFAAVLVVVTSILALTTHSLPRWLGWLGVPVALGSLILLFAHVAPLSLPLLNIWLVATSVHLVRSPALAPAGKSTWNPEVASSRA